jgi:hypothetical protein
LGELRQQARQQNVRAPEVDDDDDDEKLADSGMLAKLTSRLQGQAHGLVDQLLGGGMKGNPLVKGALGGIAATAAKRFMGK